MAGIGLIITLAGFIITLLGLGVTTSVNTRMLAALAGIAVSLFGIFGVLNQAFLKKAIWRK